MIRVGFLGFQEQKIGAEEALEIGIEGSQASSFVKGWPDITRAFVTKRSSASMVMRQKAIHPPFARSNIFALPSGGHAGHP